MNVGEYIAFAIVGVAALGAYGLLAHAAGEWIEDNPDYPVVRFFTACWDRIRSTVARALRMER